MVESSREATVEATALLLCDDEEEDDEEDEVSLGFAIDRHDDPNALLRNHFPSKLGGRPAWLDPVQLPLESQLRCGASGAPLRFLLQVYASINDDARAFHRTVFLFISPHGSRLGELGAARAFRCQLPRVNDFYADEPAAPDELPRPLTDPLAVIAKRRCARYAELPLPLPPSMPLSPVQSPTAAAAADEVGAAFTQDAGFRESELVVEPEPSAEEALASGVGAHSEQVARLLAAYQARSTPHPAQAAQSGQVAQPVGSSEAAAISAGASAGAAAAAAPADDSDEDGNLGGNLGIKSADDSDDADLSAFGAPDEDLSDFSAFTARVQRAPEQCLRYTYAEATAPLWASRRRRPKPGSVPPCARCGGPRRFEFQVMPQAIHYLGIDSLDREAPDWATICVYTCAASCAPIPPLPSLDGVVTDPSTDDKHSPEAVALVGHPVRISGLQGRPELNGSTGTVLFWAGEGRWAVEVGAGDKVKLRSANLTLVRADGVAPATLEREGGYAEEFVWVQNIE